MDNTAKNPPIPDGQRTICGLFAVAGVVVTAIMAWSFLSADAHISIGEALIYVVGALWGTFLFGYAALKGRPPFKLM